MPPRFCQLPSADRAAVEAFCAGVDDEGLRRRLAGDLAEGTVRPQWCWTAYAGDRPVARHYWWGPTGAETPVVFVPVGVGAGTDVTAAAALAVHAREQIGVQEAWSEVTLPGDGRGDPWSERPQLTSLLDQAGFAYEVDRVRIEWLAGTPLGDAGDRLRFVPAGSLPDDDLVELFAAVADGSLDHSMRTGRDRLGRVGEAWHRIDFDRRYPGVGNRFVVAVDQDGARVGYVVPALMRPDLGVVAEIGVAAGQRGRGYVDDLLRHATATLAGEGVRRIVADTDCANRPMRAAFERAGYRVFARRWDWGWRR